MSSFDDRETSFENKFKHDKELEFKATARRNKLLGLWAANLLGIHGAEAETYAKTVIKADDEWMTAAKPSVRALSPFVLPLWNHYRRKAGLPQVA